MKALLALAALFLLTTPAQAQLSDRYQLPMTTDAQSIQSFLYESLVERVDGQLIQQNGNAVRLSDGRSAVTCLSRNAVPTSGQPGIQVMSTSCLLTGLTRLERPSMDSASTQAVLTRILRARHQLQMRARFMPGSLMVEARMQGGTTTYTLTRGPETLLCAELSPSHRPGKVTAAVQRYACRLLIAARN